MAMVTHSHSECPDETTGPYFPPAQLEQDAQPGDTPAPLQCGWCLRRMDEATHRPYGPRLPEKIEGANHWLCTRCGRSMWGKIRAAHPDKRIVTYRTYLRQLAREQQRAGRH